MTSTSAVSPALGEHDASLLHGVGSVEPRSLTFTVGPSTDSTGARVC